MRVNISSRLSVVVMVLVDIIISANTVCGGDDKALLDELIAGTEANRALLAFGSATYVVKETTFQPSEVTISRDVTVHFDGPRTRVDTETDRVIVDDERYIRYTPPETDPGAIIRPRSEMSPFVVHPLMQGVGGVDQVAQELRSIRDFPQVKLTLSKSETGIVDIVALFETAFARNEFVIDTRRGYNVIRCSRWGLKVPEKPYFQADSEFTRCDNGAFVLSHCFVVNRIATPTNEHFVLQDVRMLDITLTHIDVKQRPDPTLFTLAGLDLPPGTRVQDRIAGKELLYGRPAVRESDIVRTRLSGPRAGHNAIYYVVGSLVVAILAAAVGWRVYRRKRL